MADNNGADSRTDPKLPGMFRANTQPGLMEIIGQQAVQIEWLKARLTEKNSELMRLRRVVAFFATEEIVSTPHLVCRGSEVEDRVIELLEATEVRAAAQKA